MPRDINIKKVAAAKVKSGRVILRCAPEAFMSVQSAKGNGCFILRTKEGKDVRAGRISRGVRISVGQIVVTEGDHDLGVEVTAVISERHEAEELVREGRMPAEVLRAAIGAGSIEGSFETALEDLFEAPEPGANAEVEPSRGGARARREAEAVQRSIASRMAAIMAGGEVDVSKL